MGAFTDTFWAKDFNNTWCHCDISLENTSQFCENTFTVEFNSTFPFVLEYFDFSQLFKCLPLFLYTEKVELAIEDKIPCILHIQYQGVDAPATQGLRPSIGQGTDPVPDLSFSAADG